MINIDADTLLVDALILAQFPREKSINVKNQRVGIFTKDEEKARTTIERLVQLNQHNVASHKRSKGCEELMLNDGTLYQWIKPTQSSRGARCGRAYIDRNITHTEFYTVVLPICVLCTYEDIIIF